mmetsp:Transcript_28884/g.92247  ORF Transcript_28884/g.92247 Transcript_28884/m.92247 type:complete len:99 (-) Transcript_28884:118-414(-)
MMSQADGIQVAQRDRIAGLLSRMDIPQKYLPGHMTAQMIIQEMQAFPGITLPANLDVPLDLSLVEEHVLPVIAAAAKEAAVAHSQAKAEREKLASAAQ